MTEQIKPPHPMKSTLANLNFRLLWSSGSISVFSSQFTLIVLPCLVLQLTQDPRALGLVLGAFGWVSYTWLDFLLIQALGLGNGYIALVLITWIQQSTPREMLGRVMSIVMLAGIGLVPLSHALAGLVIKWNLTGMFALSGGLMLLLAGWVGLNPGLKTLSQ